MEGVGFERFADVLTGHFVESAGAGKVDGESDEEHDDSGEAGLDVNGMKEEAVESLVNNVEGGENEKAGFQERGEIFEFAVAVGMTRVSRPIGNADREKGDDGGDEVQAGMEGFGKDAKTAGAPDEKGLQAKKDQGGADAEEGGTLLFLDSGVEAAREDHEVLG